jgi:hypothetical protein
LRRREVTSARAIPNAMEEENESMKMPKPFSRESAGFPSPLNRDNVLRVSQMGIGLHERTPLTHT